MATIKKSSKTKKIIAAVCIVLVVAIIGTVIGVAASSNQKTAVTLTAIGTGEINESVNATGTVSAGMEREYKVGAVATVKEVFVQTGDQVKEGDLLATFDTSGLDEQISSLNSTYQQARSSYLQSVETQSTAKSNLNALNDRIADLEAQVEKAGGETAQTTARTTVTTTRRTTTTTTTTTTQPASQPTEPSTETTSELTTSESVSYPATIEGVMQAVTDLVETITSLSDDVQQTNELVRVVMEQISSELSSGNYAPEKIAQAVGDAVSQAIREGLIEETELIIESGVAVEMIESAVAAIDWSAVGESFASSPNIQLAALELQLAALYAQQQIYQFNASDDTVFAKKQVMDSAKSVNFL